MENNEKTLIMEKNETNRTECSSKREEFLRHIKTVSEEVEKWPKWKQVEYVNVYEKLCKSERAKQSS